MIRGIFGFLSLFLPILACAAISAWASGCGSPDVQDACRYGGVECYHYYISDTHK